MATPTARVHRCYVVRKSLVLKSASLFFVENTLFHVTRHLRRGGSDIIYARAFVYTLDRLRLK